MEKRKITEVVAALIRDGDRFMICRRPAHKARGLLWEFVGGKVEPGETEEEALIRECREELDVTVKVGELFTEVLHEYPDLTVHLSLFNAEIVSGKPKMLEHCDIRWITPDMIPDFDFCPADHSILDQIKNSYNTKQFKGETTMKIEEILSKCDHTLLGQTATWDEIRAICDDGIKYGTASVCIPPYYVKQAKEYVGNKLAICTVIGFPNGYNTTAVKLFETEQALKEGADEIDMVINIGALKDKKYDYVENEIRTLKKVCGDKILKVIIETCLLTDDEKVKMCELVTAAGADFIKTSTGFSKAGATFEDIELFSKHIGKNVRMKAAGGIATLDDAEKFVSLGASRLGTSRVVKIVKAQENK